MIHYLVGDATEPQGEGLKIIAHVCNNVGAWGAGFTGALDRKSSSVGMAYRKWFERYSPELGPEEMLGSVFWTFLQNGLVVANMVAQNGIGTDRMRIRYNSLERCLYYVSQEALANGLPNKTVHMPRIGCGLAGGRWEEVEPIIQRELIAKGVEVYIYDLPPAAS